MKRNVAYCTRRGPREQNEDNGLALHIHQMKRELVLLGVCDGMGGESNGQRAAAEITVHLCGFVGQLLGNMMSSHLLSLEERLREEIKTWFRQASERLSLIRDNEGLAGLATTLVACALWDDQGVIWWAGDSRAYVFREGRLERLTADHSKVEEILKLPEDQALEHPERNQITRFLRPEAVCEPEIRFCECHEGDVFFLVSDGVSGSCRSYELESFIAYLLAGEVSPEMFGQRILEYIQKNESDNASIAVAFCGTPKPFSSHAATLDLPTFTEKGLRQELKDLLTGYAINSTEWVPESARPWAGWAQPDVACPTEGYGPRIANVSALAQPRGAVCLTCGRRLAIMHPCPEHGQDNLWEGLYLEIISPLGEKKFVKFDKPEMVIGRPGYSGVDIPLEQDQQVSAAHLVLRKMDGFIVGQDLDSDNGTWTRVENNADARIGRVHHGDCLRVGQHHLVILSTCGAEELGANGPAESDGAVRSGGETTECKSSTCVTSGEVTKTDMPMSREKPLP